MEMRLLKLQLFYNYSAKTLLIRIFLFGTAMAAIPCFLFVREIEAMDGCDSWKLPNFQIFKFRENSTFKAVNEIAEPKPLKASVFSAVFQDLIDRNWLFSGDRALCVGRNSAQPVMALRKLGFSTAIGIDSRPCSSLVRRGDVYSLPFGDGSFDFVFSRSLDGVKVPARLVLEMERILKPGKVGMVFRRISGRFPADLIKTAAPVSSFLSFSDVIHVRTVNCSAAVVFKKRSAVAGAEKPQLLAVE